MVYITCTSTANSIACWVHEQGTRTRLFHVQNREELDLGAMIGQADHVNEYGLLITFEG